MKFVFVGYNHDTGSQHMRGVEIVKSLIKSGIDAKFILNDDIKKIK